MSKNDTCEIFSYDEDKVKRIQNDLNTVDIVGVSVMLKAIANENRAKITYALSQERELCVCDIAHMLDVTVANASQHLRILYKQGIVTYRKKGKLSFYSLDDEHIEQIMTIAIIHQKEVAARV